MENLLARLQGALQRTSDRVLGRHVQVARRAPEIENLDARRLRLPAADVLESDDELLIRADTPGGHPENTWVYWDERAGLSVYVQRVVPPTTQAHVQAGAGVPADAPDADFYRSFALPEYVDADAMRASVKDGVLTVHVPKRDTAAPVAVPVTAG